jgi:hypothetical protein
VVFIRRVQVHGPRVLEGSFLIDLFVPWSDLYP